MYLIQLTKYDEAKKYAGNRFEVVELSIPGKPEQRFQKQQLMLLQKIWISPYEQKNGKIFNNPTDKKNGVQNQVDILNFKKQK